MSHKCRSSNLAGKGNKVRPVFELPPCSAESVAVGGDDVFSRVSVVHPDFQRGFGACGGPIKKVDNAGEQNKTS